MSDINYGDAQKPAPKIHAAMLQVMREVKAVSKDKSNQQQGFKYRGIDDMYAALHECFAKAGIYCRTEALERHVNERVTAKGGTMFQVVCKYRFHFCAEDGSSVFSEMYGEAMDSADKATSKTASISHKYALIQAFVIPTEDMVDPDASSPEPSFDTATPAPQNAPQPALEAPRAPTQPKAQPPVLTGNMPIITQMTMIEDSRLLEVKEYTGKTKSGKDYTKWTFTLSNGLKVSTFDSQLAIEATALVAADGSKPVEVEVAPSKSAGYYDLHYVKEADDLVP